MNIQNLCVQSVDPVAGRRSFTGDITQPPDDCDAIVKPTPITKEGKGHGRAPRSGMTRLGMRREV